MSKVFKYKVNDYVYEDVRAAIDKIAEGISLEKFLEGKKKILVKPNLLCGSSIERAVTTHPMVVEAVVDWLHDHGFNEIVIADSPSGPAANDRMKTVYSKCGYTYLAEKAELNMSEESVKFQTPEGFENSSFQRLKCVCEADAIIDIAKLKTHTLTKMTCAIKNLYGTIPGLTKGALHAVKVKPQNFAKMLVEIALSLPPTVGIVDGIVGMEGDGPSNGNAINSSILMGSDNIFALDEYCCKFMEIDPDSVHMIRLARQMGLIGESELCGEEIEPMHFKLPDNFVEKGEKQNTFQRFVNMINGLACHYEPEFDKNICVGCGMCVSRCPKLIIELHDGKADKKKKGCISCFCCQEICPKNAIKLKKKLGWNKELRHPM